METWSTMLAVGVLFVLPQIVGFAAARVGRRISAARWPLAAVGVVCVFWVLAAIRGAARGGVGPCVPLWLYALPMMVLHFAVGSIFGVLDQRARAARRPGR
jgi:hypothetical protein